MNAQVCKIKIAYDDNGYRIKRTLDCTKPAPGPLSDSNKATVVPGSTGHDVAGTRDQLNGIFQVYPNPTENLVYVSLDATLMESKCTITVTDIEGRVLISRKVTDAVTAIDLTTYASGTYSIILQRDSGVNTVKVIKR